MTNKMWARRSLMSGMSAVAAALAFGARPTSAQAAAAPFQPARHPQDEWLDKIPGKHRVVFDVVSSRGVPEALHFANNIYSGNKSMYGLEQGDLAVLIVLRHAATAFGYSDAIWAKYGKAMPDLTKPAARSAEIACAGAVATLIVIGSFRRAGSMVGRIHEYYIRATRASRRGKRRREGPRDEATPHERLQSLGEVKAGLSEVD